MLFLMKRPTKTTHTTHARTHARTHTHQTGHVRLYDAAMPQRSSLVLRLGHTTLTGHSLTQTDRARLPNVTSELILSLY